MKITIQKFTEKDYPLYRAWFEDKALQRTIGGIDQEWLEYILRDEDSSEYTMFYDGELVGVLGVQHPSKKEQSYVITNIAIKPALKNKGFGTKMLWEVVKLIKLKSDEYWVSYVDRSNKNAQQFFEKNNWNKIGEGEDDLIRYEYRREH